MDGQDEAREKLKEKERYAKGLPVKRERADSDRRTLRLMAAFVIGTLLRSTAVVFGSAWMLLAFGVPLLFCTLVSYFLTFLIPTSLFKRSVHPQAYWIAFVVLFSVATALPIVTTLASFSYQSKQFCIPEDCTIVSSYVNVLYMDGDPGYFIECATENDQDELMDFYIATLPNKGWTLVRDSRDHRTNTDSKKWGLQFQDGKNRLHIGGEDGVGFSVRYRPWRLN